MTSGRPRPGRTVVSGGYVISMDQETGDLPGGDVLVVDGRIAAVGPGGALAGVTGAEVIDASGAIVIPGLVDGHRHLWQSLLRGVASDWSLPDYMVAARSLYCGCFDEESAYLGNLLGGLESLSAGVTTVADHSHLQVSPGVSDALARGLLDSGVGGAFCYALQNVPQYEDAGAVDAGAVRDLLTRPPDEWHDANAARVREKFFDDPQQRLRFGIALPEAASYLPASEVRQLLARVKALNPFLVTGHWAGPGPDGLLAVLSEGRDWPRHTCLSHCNHLAEGDLKALAAAGVGVCTTPDIECGMGTGPLVALRFLGLGGAASVGTDLSSYARADILQQARLLLQHERADLARRSGKLPTAVGWTARQALEVATCRGAEALGLGREVGSLTAGKRADIVIVRPDPVGGLPGGDPVASLIFFTSPAEVDTVLVGGEVAKRGGVLAGTDLDDIRQRADAAAARVRTRYAQLPHPAIEQVWAGMFG